MSGTKTTGNLTGQMWRGSEKLKQLQCEEQKKYIQEVKSLKLLGPG